MKDPALNSKLSKAIIDRWGNEVAADPRDNWSRTKEQLYLEQIRELEKQREKAKEVEKVAVDGVLIPKKLINRDKSRNRICSVCKCYSLKYQDDLYINKFQTCYKCYIEKVEGREDKWKEENSKG